MDYLLQNPVVLHGHMLSVKEIDLHQVYPPYLIVREVPPFMCQQRELLKTLIESWSSAQIQSIEVKGVEVWVHFVDPTGMQRLLAYSVVTTPIPNF